MKQRDLFNKFIKKGTFDYESIEDLKESLSIDDTALIRKIFKKINEEIGYLDETTHFVSVISNCIDLLQEVCNYKEFNEDEVLTNRLRIKKVREDLLYYAHITKCEELREDANKLDEIVLDKSIDLEDLTNLLKKLIDKKEDVNIIKKILNTNKGVLIQEKNELFDYVFNNSLLALQSSTADIYYYIALLKIFYSSNIDRTKYLKDLNAVSDETNEFANEIYYILHGHRRPYSPEEVIEKYDVITNFETVNIDNDKLIKSTNDFVLSLDSDGTQVRDDALSIKKDGNNYIVGIHIVDPTYYVQPKSVLDFQAANNFTCTYMPDYSTRILPMNIENALSLDKGNTRRVISMYVILSNTGNIKDYFLVKDIVNIKENLSYTQGDNLLNNPQDIISIKLRQLYEVANLLQMKNSKKYLYWEKKEHDSIDKVVTNYHTSKIINELMVLYNNLIGELACNQGMPYTYRTQNNAYLNNLIKKMDIHIDDETQKIINGIYLKSKYSTVPIYHSGLGLNVYSHSTSPLRRYPDLYNQYLLNTFYFGDMNMDYDPDKHERLIQYFNQRSIEMELMQSEYVRALKIKGD